MFTYLMSWWDIAVGGLHDSLEKRERGSVTMENVIWALAVIVIAAIVVAAITYYVNKHSTDLMAQ